MAPDNTPTALKTFYSKLSSSNGGDITNYVAAEYKVANVQFGDIYKGALKNLPPPLQSIYTPIPPIAIQVLKVPSNLQSNENQSERFKKIKEKLRGWRQLDHDNIVRVLGVTNGLISTDDDDEEDKADSGFPKISIVTPWFTGGAKILTYLEDNPDADKMAMLAGIARGLARLHGSRPVIIHGCLTPENIMVNAQGVPCLTNFGLGPLMEEGTLWRTAGKREGMGVRYAAPELLRSVKVAYSTAADVYAFGMTCFGVMAKSQPFAEYSNDAAVWAAVVTKKQTPTRPPNPQIRDSLWEELSRCWTWDPNGRSSAAQLENAMADLTKPSDVSSEVKLVSGSDDKKIRIWNAEDGTLIDPIDVSLSVQFLAVSPNGSRIAVGAAPGATGKTLAVLNVTDDSNTELWSETTGCGAVAFSPDGRQLASSSLDNKVVLWESDTGRKNRVFPAHGGKITSIVFSPTGDRIVSGSLDKTVKIWNVSSTSEQLTLFKGSSFVNSVTWSNDGQTVAAAFRNNTIRMWNTTGVEKRPIQPSSMMLSVAFSPTQPLLVTGSYDGSLHFWDPQTGRESGAGLKHHSQGITSIAFKDDGTLLATASDDKKVRIWDVQTKNVVEPPSEHDGKVKCVAFIPARR